MTLDDTDLGHDSCRGGVAAVACPHRRQRAELEERGSGIDDLIDPLAPSLPRTVALDSSPPAATAAACSRSWATSACIDVVPVGASNVSSRVTSGREHLTGRWAYRRRQRRSGVGDPTRRTLAAYGPCADLEPVARTEERSARCPTRVGVVRRVRFLRGLLHTWLTSWRRLLQASILAKAVGRPGRPRCCSRWRSSDRRSRRTASSPFLRMSAHPPAVAPIRSTAPGAWSRRSRCQRASTSKYEGRLANRPACGSTTPRRRGAKEQSAASWPHDGDRGQGARPRVRRRSLRARGRRLDGEGLV